MPEIDGKTLEQVAQERGEEPWETGLELTIRGKVSCIFFVMREETIRTFMRHPAVFAASDGHLRVLGRGVSHPRNYGTFPRWVGHYGRDEGFFTVEEVVRKCASMPAQVRPARPGRLAPQIADIVLFDWETIIDRATRATSVSRRVPHVIVAGRQLPRRGRGRVIRAGAAPGR